MFLDDDIQDISNTHVAALAAALDNHNVSVLIPDKYPDNSVACHANRLGGGEQGNTPVRAAWVCGATVTT